MLQDWRADLGEAPRPHRSQPLDSPEPKEQPKEEEESNKEELHLVSMKEEEEKQTEELALAPGYNMKEGKAELAVAQLSVYLC